MTQIFITTTLLLPNNNQQQQPFTTNKKIYHGAKKGKLKVFFPLTQFGSVRIFLTYRFYVKSTLVTLQLQRNLSEALNFGFDGHKQFSKLKNYSYNHFQNGLVIIPLIWL